MTSYKDIADPIQVVQTNYDTIDFEKHDAYISAHEFPEEWNGFIRGLAPNSMILNIGGSAPECQLLIDQGFRVTALDISQKVSEHISKSSPETSIVWADITKYHSGQYDAAWACRSLIHIPPTLIDVALLNISRMVKPGGRIGIVIFTVDGDSAVEESFYDQLASKDNIVHYRVLYPKNNFMQRCNKIGKIMRTIDGFDQDHEKVLYLELENVT